MSSLLRLRTAQIALDAIGEHGYICEHKFMEVAMRNENIMLMKRVEEILHQQGFMPVQSPQSASFDAVYLKRDACLVLEAKTIAVYRATEFRAMIGDAILRYNAAYSGTSTCLMLAIEFGRMGRSAEADLKEYAERFLPGLCWILASRDGDVRLHLAPDDDQLIQGERPQRPRGEPVQAERRLAIFSPKSQWLWKSILLPGLDSRYWSGSNQVPRSVTELSQRSGVSQSVVSAFVGRAVSAGFLKRNKDSFVVVNHRELLDDWAHALKNRRRRIVKARSMYGDIPEEELLANVRDYCQKALVESAKPLVVVGSHLACHLLGLGRSNQRHGTLYMRAAPIEDALEALGLVPAPDGEDNFLSLEWNGMSESIGRGCVMVDGVPVADALQCYLDVRPSYARGREQADFIYERILQPHFERS